MSGVATAVVVSGYLGAEAAKSSAKKSASAQQQAAEAGITEQRAQFDAIQELLRPYVQAGTGAMEQQQQLLGLAGIPQQQQAISVFEQSPQFQALARQGEQSILQNASATGGLRGGNVQAALAQFRPALLNQQIQQQLQNLGGLSSLGQASAAGQAAAGQQLGQSIASSYGDIGAAQAGSALAQGQAQSNLYGALGSAAGYALRPKTQAELLAEQNAGF